LCLACYRSPNWPSKLYLPESGNELFRAVPTDPLARYLNTASELAEQAAVDDDDYADLDADAPLGG